MARGVRYCSRSRDEETSRIINAAADPRLFLFLFSLTAQVYNVRPDENFNPPVRLHVFSFSSLFSPLFTRLCNSATLIINFVTKFNSVVQLFDLRINANKLRINILSPSLTRIRVTITLLR